MWRLPGAESWAEMQWSTIFIVVMIVFNQLLMLALIVILAHKLNRLVAKIDQISQNAGKFLQMGMTYFKKK